MNEEKHVFVRAHVYVWADGAEEAIEDCLTSIWWETAEAAKQDKADNPDCYNDGRDRLFEITIIAKQVAEVTSAAKPCDPSGDQK